MTDEPSQEPVVSRRAAFYGKVLLLIAGTLIGLVLAEVGLRVARVAFPLPYTTDPDCGTLLQPGFRAWFHKEGHGYVEVNQWGFRDSERTRQKPDDVFRIAVLGDSYAEALQVMDDETFWSVMERELQQAGVLPGKRIEVLNFGISGFGTAQELLVLRHHVWQFDPDVVLLLFTSGNDVRNNSKRLERTLEVRTASMISFSKSRRTRPGKKHGTSRNGFSQSCMKRHDSETSCSSSPRERPRFRSTQIPAYAKRVRID